MISKQPMVNAKVGGKGTFFLAALHIHIFTTFAVSTERHVLPQGLRGFCSTPLLFTRQFGYLFPKQAATRKDPYLSLC